VFWHLRAATERTGLVRRAFTVFELVATMVVVAILASVGAVGLNAVNDRQQRDVAKADLDMVAQSQLRFASLYDTFTDYPLDLTGFAAPPKAITVTTEPSSASRVVSIALGSEGGLGLSARAIDGACLFRYLPPLGSLVESEQWLAEEGALCEARAAFPEGEHPLEPASPPVSRRDAGVLSDDNP
jgi:prepilin-type N-terminal cleavage/methylation domain-containing protein